MSSEEMLEKLKSINAGIRWKELLPFYYFYGNEDYFITSLKNGIIKAFGDETGLNVKIYTKDNFNPREVIKQISSMPFMNEKKLMVFDNIDYFKKSKLDSAEKEDTENNKEIKNMLSAFESAKDINIVLYLKYEYDEKSFSGYNKDNVFLQFFDKNGVALELKKLDENNVWKYVQNRFKKSGIDIDRVSIAKLVRVCGTDLNNLFNEVDKLIAFAGDNNTISESDIREIVTKNIDDNIYNLINLYNENKREEAIKFYGDLLSEGKKDDEIFSKFSYNYSGLIECKDFMDKGKGQKEIAELMGIEPWRVKKLMDANKYVTMDILKDKMKRITDLSVARMKGNINENHMMLLLMN